MWCDRDLGYCPRAIVVVKATEKTRKSHEKYREPSQSGRQLNETWIKVIQSHFANIVIHSLCEVRPAGGLVRMTQLYKLENVSG